MNRSGEVKGDKDCLALLSLLQSPVGKWITLASKRRKKKETNSHISKIAVLFAFQRLT